MKPTKMTLFRTALLLAAPLFALMMLGAVLVKFDVVSKLAHDGIGNASVRLYQKLSREGLSGASSALLEKIGNAAMVQDPSLKYSLFDKKSYPPIESANARRLLPGYEIMPAAAADELAPSRNTGQRYDTWQRSNGDDFSSKYSSLSQINRSNVATPALEAYDLNSGKLLWSRSWLDRSGTSNLYGAVPWGGMPADVARSAVYVATGNPRPEIVGTSLPGANRHSSSVLSINADTGDIIWTFQIVAHDLWELDVPAAPVLTTISNNGKRIDGVATVTKTGNTVLLERDAGKPIFAYRLRKAPVSLIPGEQTAPYQPQFDLPEPFSKQVFEESDVTDLSASAHAVVMRKTKGAGHGFFTPPVIGGNIVLYRLHGGAQWPGAAVDQARAILYVPPNQLPWIIQVGYLDPSTTPQAGAKVAGNALYQAKCTSCHRADRSGSFDNERQGDAYVLALTGIAILRARQVLVSTSAFDEAHAQFQQGDMLTGVELERLFAYFSALDHASDKAGAFVMQPIWQLLLENECYPGTKPPWGLLTALDLNSGKKIWQAPLGQYDDVLRNRRPVQGQRNHGGVAVTAGALVFTTGTIDNKLRAFDASDGKELWSFTLPAAGSAPPSTYFLHGVQYVVVVASGRLFHGYSGRSDKVIAFKLPHRGAKVRPDSGGLTGTTAALK